MELIPGTKLAADIQELLASIYRDCYTGAERWQRDNVGAQSDVAEAGGWKALENRDVGMTFGRTSHVPRHCEFCHAARRDLMESLQVRVPFGEDDVPVFDIEPSGFIIYEGGSGMGWHTNSLRPGKRVYFTHTEGGGTFRYAQNGRESSIGEPQGWHRKVFDIPAEGPPLWHAINATSRRISIGFRIRERNT